MLAAVRETRGAMIADLMGRLAAGKINARNIESQRRSRFKGLTKAAGRLREVLGDVGSQGIEHVQGEIAKQRGPRT